MFIVQAGIAAGLRLHFVEEVSNQFREGQLVDVENHLALVYELLTQHDSPLFLAELLDRGGVLEGGHDGGLHDGFLPMLDVLGRRGFQWVVYHL